MSDKLIVIFPPDYGVRGFFGDQVVNVEYSILGGCSQLQVNLHHEQDNWWDEAALVDLVGTKLDVYVTAGTITSVRYDSYRPDVMNCYLALTGTFFESYQPNSIVNDKSSTLVFGGGKPSWTCSSAKQVKQ